MAAVVVAVIGLLAFVVSKVLYDRHMAVQRARATELAAMPPPPAPNVDAGAGPPYRVAAPHTATAGATAEVSPDAELERLAARGATRARDEGTRRDAEEKRQLEWVRLHRLCGAMKLLPDGPTISTTEAAPAEAQFPLAQVVPGNSETSYTAAPPLDAIESAARKAHAESAWLRSLPFPIERYFFLLADDPLAGRIAINSFCLSVTVELADPSSGPSRELLDGVLHGHDVRAVVMHAASPILFQSREMSAVSSQGFDYTTENIPPYVHGLVDKVLMPLHRSRPIARVSLARV